MEKTDLYKPVSLVLGNQKYFIQAAKLCAKALAAFNDKKGNEMKRTDAYVYYNYAQDQTEDKIWQLAEKLRQYDTERQLRTDYTAMLDTTINDGEMKSK